MHLLDTRTIFLLHFCNIYAHLDLPAIVEAKGPATDEIHAFDTILRIRLNHASQVCWTTTILVATCRGAQDEVAKSPNLKIIDQPNFNCRPASVF